MAFEKGYSGAELMAQNGAAARQGLSSEYIQSMIGKPPTPNSERPTPSPSERPTPKATPDPLERQSGEPEEPNARADFWMKRLDILTPIRTKALTA